MYHFIGIKGSGMSALAQIMKSIGCNVEGSDVSSYFFTEDGLKKLNINIENTSEYELIPLIFEYKNNKNLYAKNINENIKNIIKNKIKFDHKYKNIKNYIEIIIANEKMLDDINKILSDIEKQTTKENIEDMENILNFLNTKFKNFEYIIKNYPDNIIYLKKIKNYIKKTNEKIDSLYTLIEEAKLKANLKEKNKNKKNIPNEILTPEQLKFFQEKKEHIKEKMSLENDIIRDYRGIIFGYSEQINQYLEKLDLSSLKNFFPKSNIEKEKIEILKKKLNLKNDHFKKQMFDLNIKLNEKNFSIRDFILDFNTKFARDYKHLNSKIGRILTNIKNYLEQ